MSELTPQMIRDTAILLLAADSVLWDNQSIEAAVPWAQRFASAMDTAPEWSDGKHFGDCTNQPNPCIRCQFEEYERTVKLLWASDDDIPALIDTCMEAMTTPFEDTIDTPSNELGDLKP